MNPYQLSTEGHDTAQGHETADGSKTQHTGNATRWSRVVFISVLSACASAIGGLLYIELFSRAGDFTEIVALAAGLVSGAIGGAIGLIGGIVYAFCKA